MVDSVVAVVANKALCHKHAENYCNHCNNGKNYSYNCGVCLFAVIFVLVAGRCGRGHIAAWLWGLRITAVILHRVWVGAVVAVIGHLAVAVAVWVLIIVSLYCDFLQGGVVADYFSIGNACAAIWAYFTAGFNFTAAVGAYFIAHNILLNYV